MKVAITASDTSLDGEVDPRFGRARSSITCQLGPTTELSCQRRMFFPVRNILGRVEARR